MNIDSEENQYLHVFSSHRAIKDFYSHTPYPIKPKATTIEEFFDLSLSIKGYCKIPKSAQKILLLQTLYNYKNLHRLLIFEESFLAYLEGSEFLKHFFDELDSTLCDIKQIPKEDTYGDYEDHLKLLSQIYHSYHARLDMLKFYTNYSTQNFEINYDLLASYKGIRIYLNGVLSPREQRILIQLSKSLNIEIIFDTDCYNLAFFSFLNLAIEANQSYHIKLGEQSLILNQSSKNPSPQINAYHFNTRIDQCSLIIAKAQEWLNSNKENVAIILPDENFAPFLRVIDSNFNYAMGLDIKQMPYYTSLAKQLQTKNITSINDLQTLAQETLNQHYHKEIESFNQSFFLMLQQLENLKSLNLDTTHLCDFYLDELSMLKISDNRGGKIPVYGILETRGMKFDSIVIVDFNEENLFDLKDNDLFLNTSIRQKLHMPTLIDKKNLKKHYYYQLITNTKNIDIALIKTHTPQYFLESLHIKPKEFMQSIFHFDTQKSYIEDMPKTILLDNFTFSASSLKTYLECKRKFYLRYIEKIPTPEDASLNLGKIFHNILYDAYKNNAKDGIPAVKKYFDDAFNMLAFNSLTDKLEAQIAHKKIKGFWEREQQRFDMGYRFFQAEFDFEFIYHGLKFKGRIDRIDKKDNDLVLLDYKFKNTLNLPKSSENLTDFQLQIYRLALESLGYTILSSMLINGYDGSYKEEGEHEEKCEILRLKLEQIKKNTTYEKSDKISTCTYCDYKILCNRNEKTRIKIP